MLFIDLPENIPSPQIVDHVEGEGRHSDQGLAHQEVDVLIQDIIYILKQVYLDL